MANEPREWKVQFMVPTAEFTPLYKYIIGAGMNAQGAPGKPDLIGGLVQGGMKLLLKGLPVSGVLRVDREGILFTPIHVKLQKIAYKEISSIYIPKSDFIDARPQRSFLGVVSIRLSTPMLIIKTINGEFFVSDSRIFTGLKEMARNINHLLK